MQSYAVGDEPVPGYCLTRFLGRGGFGQVWEAQGPGGVNVALKIISLEGSEGLKEFRAIGLVKRLNNPNLVPLHGYWLKDEFGGSLDAAGGAKDSINLRGKSKELVIAMGLGEKSLAQRLDECKREGRSGMPTEELLDYMAGAARAIDYLNQPMHSLGSGPPMAIQHCDIKPANLLIVGNGIQVCDYGLARALTDDVRATTQSAGTPAYSAPELFVNKPSPRTDQYSLAITYYELRTGRLPFAEHEAIQAHIMGNLDLSLLPPAEREVIRKATHLKPDKRYPQTIDLVRALREAVNQSPAAPAGQPTSVGAAVPAAHLPTLSTSIDELIRAGHELVPHYKLLRLIGRGGYGEVWEARGPGGKRCALKIVRGIDAGKGNQELRSLKLIRDLDHDRLINLQAYWLLTPDGTVIPDDLIGQPGAPQSSVLVMACDLAAKSLLDRWTEYSRRGEPGIPPPELLRYIRQAAEAIDYMNAQGIQHRDIKPENILLTKDSRVKVSDFGLAKLVEGTSAEVGTASVGLTAAYAPPELFRNTVSRWTDQYSLALTYYKLRSGHWPFPSGSGPFQIMQAHAEGRLEFGDVTEEERRVLTRATSIDPPARYPNCLDMVEEMAVAMGVSLIPSSAGSVPLIPDPLIPSPTPSDRPNLATPAKSISPSDLKPYENTITSPVAEAAPPRPAELLTPTSSPELPAGTMQFIDVSPERRTTPPHGHDLVETDVRLPQRPDAPPLWPQDDDDDSRRPAPAPGQGWGIVAGVVLVLGLAATAWFIFGRDRPRVDPRRADTEQQVAQLVEQRKYPDAVQRVAGAAADGVGDTEWAEKLREGIRGPWRRDAFEEPDPVRQGAKLKEFLAAFHDADAVAKLKDLTDREVATQAAAQFDNALRQARQALNRNDFVASRKELGEAERHAAQESQRRQLQPVRALVLARDPSATDAEADEAADLLKRLLDQTEPGTDFAAPSRAYADLAERKPRLRDGARPVLEKVASRLSGFDVDHVQGRLTAWKNPALDPTAVAKTVDAALGRVEKELATGKLSPEQLGRLKSQLSTATKEAGQVPDSAGNRARRLQALTVWLEVLTPATAAKARPRLKALLLDERPHEPAQLCRVFLEQYGSEPDILADARQVLTQTLARPLTVVPTSDKKVLTAAFQKLLSAYVRRQLAAPAPDWKSLLQNLAEAGEENVWAQAAKAEALCSQNGSPATGPDLDAARRVVEANSAELGPYGQYVVGLLRAADEPIRAAAAMLAAYEAPGDPLLALERRKKQAGAVLRNAALAARRPPQLLELPYRPEDAPDVVQWLQKAAALTGEADAPLWAGHLALAAWQAKNVELAKQAIRPVTPATVDALKEDASAALLVRARSVAGDAAKLQAFADFLAREVAAYAASVDTDDPTGEKGRKLLSDVIQPAIDAGTKLGVTAKSDPALRQALGRAYASKGRVLNVNILFFKDQIPGIISSYTQAIALADPPPAEYFVGRGFARFMSIFLGQTPKKEWQEVERDASRASQQDKNYYETYVLLAAIRQFEDELEIPKEYRAEGDRLAHLNKAAEYYAKAIDLCKDSSKPTLLYNRSKLMFDLANDDGVDKAADKKRYLEEGLTNADNAIRANFRNVHKANKLKGCLLEDLGLLTGDAAQFDEAITEFERGAKLAQSKKEKDEGQYWTDLGRCQLRAAEYGRRGEKLYREAAGTLRAATGLAAGQHTAEAQYWLGRAEWAQRDFDKSDAAFRASAAAEDKTQTWKPKALMGRGAMQIDQAEWDKLRRADPAKRLETARACATELQKIRGYELAADVLRGRAAEIAGESKDAAAAYQNVRQTAEKNSWENTTVYIEALAAELRLHLDPRWGLNRIPAATQEARAKKVKDFLDNYAQLFSAGGAAAAYAAAGRALADIADQVTAKEAALRPLARECLARAVERTTAQDLHGARYRFWLAAQMEKLLNVNPGFRAEAIKLAKEAADKASSRDESQEAQALVRRLEQ